MKAVRIHEYGGISVLRFEDAPIPACEADEVLIRVVGSSVNPVDWKIREGHLRAMLAFKLPFVPGWDVSGVVHAVGARVTRFQLGDAVYSRPDIARDGTYAEFVAVRETEVARKPRTVSHIEAGVLPLAGITAWEALVTKGHVKAGQRVLAHAAAGGVGFAGGADCQGAWRARHRHRLEHQPGAGGIAGRGRVCRLPNPGPARRGTQRGPGARHEGGRPKQASWHVMAPEGMLVSIASDPATGVARWPQLRGEFLFIQPNAPVLEKLAAMVDGGQLRPVIGAEFALHDIQRAHALSETGHADGKIAIYVGQP